MYVQAPREIPYIPPPQRTPVRAEVGQTLGMVAGGLQTRTVQMLHVQSLTLTADEEVNPALVPGRLSIIDAQTGTLSFRMTGDTGSCDTLIREAVFQLIQSCAPEYNALAAEYNASATEYRAVHQNTMPVSYNAVLMPQNAAPMWQDAVPEVSPAVFCTCDTFGRAEQ